MNIKRRLGQGLIIVGVFFILIIVLFFFNSRTAKCEEQHFYMNETNNCYYYNSTCKKGETQQTYNGESACFYSPITFLNSSLIKGTLVLLAGFWVLLLIILLVSIARKGQSKDERPFRKEEIIDGDKAKDLWAMWFSKHYGIPIINNTYSKSAFNFYYASEPTKRENEHFIKFQVEVLDGSYPGLFTVVLNLSRGENWISNGMSRWKEVNYDDFKIDRTWPLHTPDDPRERLIEQMFERNPERALELQEQIAEKEILQPRIGLPTPEEIRETGMPVQIAPQPQPYRKRYTYRRPTYI